MVLPGECGNARAKTEILEPPHPPGHWIFRPRPVGLVTARASRIQFFTHSGASRMRKSWHGFLTAMVAALVVGVPLVYSASRQHHRRNFRVVEDGVLYRSGQL